MYYSSKAYVTAGVSEKYEITKVAVASVKNKDLLDIQCN